MNGYKACYKGKWIEVYSDTMYHAQLEAAKQFKVPEKKSYMVTVVLCEVDGKPVEHKPDF
jgi:hypothetical protein